jgi:hypothetical protein
VEAAADLPLDLDTFARISAETAEGAPLDEALARIGLARPAWEAARAAVVRALAAEAMGDGPTPLGDAYAEALARARDAVAPTPELTPEAWGELSAAFASEGAAALEARGLGVHDHLRLARRWARVLAAEPAAAERFAAAFAAASRAGGEGAERPATR